MRTSIDIDDALIAKALKLTGLKTKREVVALALQTLVQSRGQARVRLYRGKLPWEGDLEKMRTD